MYLAPLALLLCDDGCRGGGWPVLHCVSSRLWRSSPTVLVGVVEVVCPRCEGEYYHELWINSKHRLRFEGILYAEQCYSKLIKLTGRQDYFDLTNLV